MVAFVTRQLSIEPAILGTGSDRPQTRRDQLAELMRRGGFRGFGRAEACDNAWTYKVKLLPPSGTRYRVVLDAATGAVVSAEGVVQERR